MDIWACHFLFSPLHLLLWHISASSAIRRRLCVIIFFLLFTGVNQLYRSVDTVWWEEVVVVGGGRGKAGRKSFYIIDRRPTLCVSLCFLRVSIVGGLQSGVQQVVGDRVQNH